MRESINTELCLSRPLQDLDGNQLLPAQTPLSNDVLQELARQGRCKTYPNQPLLTFKTLGKDLLGLCQQTPYTCIFSNPLRLKDLQETLAGLEFSEPLLEGIYRFKSLDPYTYRHMLIVFALALVLGQDLLSDQKERQREASAAPSHDFGKHSIPLPILTKASPLTTPEQLQLAEHTTAGFALLTYYLGDPEHPAAVTARDHHERCDGSGYPLGEPLINRIVEIVAVCDVFDALVAPRPYRPTAYDLRTALEEVTCLAESGAVHWETVQALVSCYREGQPNYQHCQVSQQKRGTPPEQNNYVGAKPPNADDVTDPSG